MSLKAVHICFILFSVILVWGLGFWGIRDYSTTKNLIHFFLGIGSFVGGALLVGYLVWFVYKMKRVPPV